MKKDMDTILSGLKRGKSANTDYAKSYLRKVESNSRNVSKKSDDFNDVIQRNNQQLNEIIQSELLQEINQDLNRINEEIEADFGISKKDDKITQIDNGQIFELIEADLNQQLIGQEKYLHQLTQAFKRPFVVGYDEQMPCNTIIIGGQNGSGRMSSLKAMAKQMKKYNLLASDELNLIDLSCYSSMSDEKIFLQDLYKAFTSQSKFIVFVKIHQCSPAFLTMLTQLVQTGKILLNKRYTLSKNQLVEVNSALASDTVSELTASGKYLIFMSDEKIDKLTSRFGSHFIEYIHDVCMTDLLDEKSIQRICNKLLTAFKEKCQARLNYQVECEESVYLYLLQQYSEARGVHALEECLDGWFEALSQYKLENHGVDLTLTLKADHDIYFEKDGEVVQLTHLVDDKSQQEIAAIKKEMEEIVGQQKVKDYLLALEQNALIQRKRAQRGLKSVPVSMHMIFTGNPGTGKTTVARIFARYLKAIGILSTGVLVEVSRKDLVGQYVGHTAPLTNQMIASAIGGVLFIDEAYSLYRGKDDSFGLEAIDTLVKAMEDNRDNLIVILAGYSKEMADFLEANSGLKSRFPNQIEFADYTGSELYAIAKSIAKNSDYRLSDECEAKLITYFDKVQSCHSQSSGNGRLARNIIEKAILKQSQRLIQENSDELDLLLPLDFDLDEE